MPRNFRTSVCVTSLAIASLGLVGCTINNVQSDCTGASCSGGSTSVGGHAGTGGATATGGSTSSSTPNTMGGSSSTGGTLSTSGGKATGGSVATGGSIATGGSTGILAPSGGTSAVASTTGGKPATGGVSSTGGTTAASSGGTSTATSTALTGGTAATGGSSSTALKDSDGDGVADSEDLCPDNPAISKPGKWNFSVVFTSAAQTYPQYLDGLKTNMIAAGQEWSKRFPVPHDVSLEIEIDIDNIATANGRSASTVYSDSVGGMMLYQQGAVYEVLTGKDPNDTASGSVPDIEITFGIDPLTGADGHYYWADPDPVARTATMPSNAVDIVSTCLHELGHALGFNGWRDWSTGELTGDYESYYDYLSSTDGTDFFFEGTRAVAKYGKKVPETYGNIAHLGNYGNGHPGADLDPDLMRGTRTLLAHRYYISDLDVAVLADIGMPAPGTDAARALCTGSGTSEPGVIELGPPPPPVE